MPHRTLIIEPLNIEDQGWVLTLARDTQVYCPDTANEHLALAAKRGGVALGYIAWQIAVDEASLLGIAIQPSARRQGIASALHHYSERRALRPQAVRTLFLEVRWSNTTAQHFYKKIGYEQVGVRRNYYEKDESTSISSSASEDALVMRKILSD